MASLTTRAVPATLGVIDRLKLSAAILVGNAAALASRVAGKGSGASVRGQLLTRLVPNAFSLLLKGRRVIAVSGTNGKTTTTHLLAAAIRTGLGTNTARLVTNSDGANLHYGIASALGQQRRADIAVLETDERVVSDLIAAARPELLVLLNFSRDQLDRHHEIKALGRAWRAALDAAGSEGPTIIANSCDPLVVWSAQTATRVIWVETDTVWHADGALCPACGELLVRAPSIGRDRWDCPHCVFTQPPSDYRVSGTQIVLSDGTSVTPNLQLPGSFNISNAACALAAAIEFGVPVLAALDGMRSVTSPAGRFATATFGPTEAHLLLSKNPSGWAEALPLAKSDPVVLAIDAAAADGKDVSWLWDVDYEQLAGRTVICTGPRANDLAVRLTYAEVEHRIEPDLRSAITNSGVAQIDVIATYTPFQALLKMAGLR